ncbi:maleylpyruvate isomerase family mycothiol-dependent enzyme [Actinokineospora sp. NBRC 105648]|uniref:maleylpyruvate isomerase family mycothiol-dependent enzyme n=1 Tax=Actinokineospora sp. NBRC 105648 TaxID=3032206 RepID=UPI0024A1E4C1|nr:maleylpyruvate isomerase family mycothiol-dependent enzyme [Actinokineospora sp. NBRC 105648]GLZ41851.1 hypothetical protein Acsp05_54750 [Actinokineospora sp. NBRC 105648]
MDHTTAWTEQNTRLVELVRPADPAAPVPTCPEWTIRQLVAHVGRGDRWSTAIVRGGEFVHPRDVPGGKPPEDPDGAADWLAQGPALLAEAVAEAGPDTPVWTFTGPKPAAWWLRRRLHEAVVHHADAAIALGAPYVVEPAVAADGISEWLDLLVAGSAKRTGPPLLAEGQSLHLHATDEGLGTAGEWLARPGPEWEHGHGKGTVAVRGPAADLLLALMRRRPADSVEVHGDAQVFETWLAGTPF